MADLLGNLVFKQEETSITLLLAESDLQMGRQVLLRGVRIEPYHILTVRFYRKCGMGGFVNPGPENTMFVYFGDKSTPFISSSRFLFPSRHSIFHYQVPGRNTSEPQDQYFSPRQRGERWGPQAGVGDGDAGGGRGAGPRARGWGQVIPRSAARANQEARCFGGGAGASWFPRGRRSAACSSEQARGAPGGL